MPKELRMRGYMIGGELHVREADCRRAISDALRTGKEELIESHDRLLAALTNVEAVMSIVEPRSDKAEYLKCLEQVRAAIAASGARAAPPPPHNPNARHP